MFQNTHMAKVSKTISVKKAARANQITDMSTIESNNNILLRLGEA